MNKIREDLYWLVTTYDGTRYVLIRDFKNNTLTLGIPDKRIRTDGCTDLDLIHSTFAPYEVENILKEIKGKKFKVWVYKGVDFRQDEIWEQESFVPEFKKVPVEATLKYFEPYMLE